MKNILILGAGGPAGKALTRCLKKHPKTHLIGTDCDKVNFNFVETDKKYLIPKVTDKAYIKNLKKIIEKEHIDFMFAQNDTEMEQISRHRDELETQFFIPTHPIIKICQNKELLFEILDKDKPKYEGFENGQINWIRAMRGAGGKGSFKVENEKDMQMWMKLNPHIKDWQISEYLPGKNVGVDIIMYKSDIIMYSMKEREKYLPGKSISGISGSAANIKIIDDKKILKIVENALLTLDNNISGVFGVDLKGHEDGTYKITEINPGRFLTSSLVGFLLTGHNLPMKVLSMFLSDDFSISQTNPKVGYKIIRQIDSMPKLIK